MRDTLEELRQQVHELRNLWAPIHLKLGNLDHDIEDLRTLFDARIDGVESRLSVNKFKVEEQAQKITALQERLDRVELVLTVLPIPARPKALPAHEDKFNPETLPSQKPRL